MKDKNAGIIKIAGAAVLILLFVMVRMYQGPGNEDRDTVKPAQEQAEISEETKQTGKRSGALGFRNSRLLEEHYEKHGKDMGFSSADEYEKAAAAAAVNPKALHKTENEDGDDVYYIEVTNEFVIVSKDGYIRTYFFPDSGKRYFDKQ